jgi:hypothetical protein
MTNSHILSASNPSPVPAPVDDWVEEGWGWTEFTMEIVARVWEEISSRLRRTLGLTADDMGDSRSSALVTLIVVRRCEGIGVRMITDMAERGKETTDLDWTFTKDHTPSGHDLLIAATEIKVPSFVVVRLVEGDDAAMKRHSFDTDSLDGIKVRINGRGEYRSSFV